jgi:CBS domain-containing protein
MTKKQWTIRDVMSEDVLTATVDTPFKVLVEQLLLEGVSGVPVLDAAGRVVGVVSAADLLVKEEQGGGSAVMAWIRHLSRLAAERDSASVERALEELDKALGRTAGDLMTSPAIVIDSDASLEEAAVSMHRHQLKRLPVVEDGRLIGIVSRGDLLKVFMQTDRSIERTVLAELGTVLSEPEAVRVLVVDGVVTLDGEVDAQPEIEAAVVRVEAMPGVVGVQSRLRAAV